MLALPTPALPDLGRASTALPAKGAFATKRPLLLIAYFPCANTKPLKELGRQVQYQPVPGRLS